jgi:hypothetical protein
MTRIEIPVEDARPGDIAMLKSENWPSVVEAEAYMIGREMRAAGHIVRSVDGDPGSRVQRIYREVPDLPTEPGSVIRATVRGVPDTVMVLADDGDWRSFVPISWSYWHETERIDLSTVRVGRIVFEEDAS